MRKHKVKRKGKSAEIYHRTGEQDELLNGWYLEVDGTAIKVDIPTVAAEVEFDAPAELFNEVIADGKLRIVDALDRVTPMGDFTSVYDALATIAHETAALLPAVRYYVADEEPATPNS